MVTEKVETSENVYLLLGLGDASSLTSLSARVIIISLWLDCAKTLKTASSELNSEQIKLHQTVFVQYTSAKLKSYQCGACLGKRCEAAIMSQWKHDILCLIYISFGQN